LNTTLLIPPPPAHRLAITHHFPVLAFLPKFKSSPLSVEIFKLRLVQPMDNLEEVDASSDSEYEWGHILPNSKDDPSRLYVLFIVDKDSSAIETPLIASAIIKN
jgi:hypothetical protein